MTTVSFPASIPQCGTGTLSFTGVTFPVRVEFYYQSEANGAWNGTGSVWDVYASPFEYQPVIPSGYILWPTVVDNTGKYLQVATGCSITSSLDNTCLADLTAHVVTSTSTVVSTQTIDLTQTSTEVAYRTVVVSDTSTNTISVAPLVTTITETELLRPSGPGGPPGGFGWQPSQASAYSSSYMAAECSSFAASRQQAASGQIQSYRNQNRIIGGVLGAILAVSFLFNLFFVVGWRNRKRRNEKRASLPRRSFIDDASSLNSYHQGTDTPQVYSPPISAAVPEFVVQRSPTMRSVAAAAFGFSAASASTDSATPKPVSSLVYQHADGSNSVTSVDTITSQNGTIGSHLDPPPRLFATNASSATSLY